MKNILIFTLMVIAVNFSSAQFENCQIETNFTKEKTVVISPPDTTGTSNPNVYDTDNERLVYWIHGLVGNIGSWAKASEASERKERNRDGFTARKLQSEEMGYSESGTVLWASDQLRNQIDNAVDSQNEGVDKNLNFIIAHSQGGVVSDALLYSDFVSQPKPKDKRFYGGQATFCTPHRGAEILDNKDQMEELALNGAEVLARAKSYGLVEDLPVVKWFVNPESFVSTFKAFLKDNILPMIMDGILVETTEDYHTDSPMLDSIHNAETPEISRVAFYSVEPVENMIWRTVTYFIHSANNEDFWDANYDFKFLDETITPAVLDYTLNYYWWAGLVELSPANGVCDEYGTSWICCSFRKKVKTRDAYLVAANWFTNVNYEYRVNIGAIKYENPVYICTCEGPIDDFDGYPSSITETVVSSLDECVDTVYETCSTSVVYETMAYESDGVVVTSSQMDIPFATSPAVRLDGSSHMQIRNSKEVREGLTELYDGEHGPFFMTEDRL